jgi:hypothetical protein
LASSKGTLLLWRKITVKKLITFTVICFFLLSGLVTQSLSEVVRPLDTSGKKEFTIIHYHGGLAKTSKIVLSQVEAQQVDTLISTLQQTVNTSTSEEEIYFLLTDAIFSLNDIGVIDHKNSKQLHGSMQHTLQQMQRVKSDVTIKNDMKSAASEINNNLCFVVGKSTATYFMSAPSYLIYVIASLLDLDDLSLYYFLIFQLLSAINCFPALAVGGFGAWDVGKTPARGWVCTCGLRGIQGLQGPFYGALDLTLLTLGCEIWFFPGILGFTGLRITNNVANTFYIGSALCVHLSTEIPTSL